MDHRNCDKRTVFDRFYYLLSFSALKTMKRFLMDSLSITNAPLHHFRPRKDGLLGNLIKKSSKLFKWNRILRIVNKWFNMRSVILRFLYIFL